MSSNPVKISVVILAYNEERFIGPCLEALKNQTVTPDEVIVVNNNSTDNTVGIVSTFNFVKLVDEKNQGMIPARNAGFNYARGKLLARIDADTQVPATWIETIHLLFDRYAEKIAGISGPQYFYDIKNKLLRKIVSVFFSNFGYFWLTKIFLRHETLFGSNMVITKVAWNKVKNEVCADSREVHEDIDLALHIGKYGKILFDNRLLVGISNRPLREPYTKHFWRLTAWINSINKHRRLFSGKIFI